MKRACLPLIAALAATTAMTAPALAQPYGPPAPPGYGAAERHEGWEIDRRIDWTQDRIDRGRADGSLDRHEFRRVQGQLNRIRHDFERARYRSGGRLDGRARASLAGRLDRLNDEIHWLRHNDERRPW
ncbi:hypothetical protein [Phenylobacterium montanum]|uniref:Uncharacterized protein n=1 Tax=Phenylobacterium montanum TaxID=2823693 RepID=A0A975G1L6_9CAUL|nr:hypothetical protein [Caulobacter sp. S6]QUD89215.1 hypothetical protein KCG34_04855 [Caulobacter sp. S6]